MCMTARVRASVRVDWNIGSACVSVCAYCIYMIECVHVYACVCKRACMGMCVFETKKISHLK